MSDTFKSFPYSAAGKDLSDRIRAKAEELEALLYEVAPIDKGPVSNREVGANVTLALRHLEDCTMRANKAISRL